MSKAKPKLVSYDELRHALSQIIARVNVTPAPLPAGPPIEPTFNLRAQDVLAPDMVEAWADALLKLRCGKADQKIAEARAIALRMRAWQAEHGCKIPD